MSLWEIFAVVGSVMAIMVIAVVYANGRYDASGALSHAAWLRVAAGWRRWRGCSVLLVVPTPDTLLPRAALKEAVAGIALAARALMPDGSAVGRAPREDANGVVVAFAGSVLPDGLNRHLRPIVKVEGHLVAVPVRLGYADVPGGLVGRRAGLRAALKRARLAARHESAGAPNAPAVGRVPAPLVTH